MSQPSPPSPPDAGQSAASYLQALLKYTPLLLSQELKYRGQYDPQFIKQQQDLQDQFGPRQYQQQLSALDQLNPYFRQVYSALGNNVLQQLDPNNPYVQMSNNAQRYAYNNLGLGQADANAIEQQAAQEARMGTHLDPAFQQQLQSEIRAAQAARGNTLGDASISGEALYQGRAAQDLYNQRMQRYIGASNNQQGVANFDLGRYLQAAQGAAGQRQIPLSNAGQFLSTMSPLQAVSQVQPVQAPDAFRLFNPNAINQGIQLGQQNYQNALAAYSMQGNGGSGWGSIIGGIGGAALGGYFGGPAGAQLGSGLGSGIGGTVGGYFSDSRIKENIKDTGKRTRDGIPIVTFNYIGLPKRYKGVLAQDVLKVRPDAVWHNRGIMGVNYDAIGARMEAV